MICLLPTIVLTNRFKGSGKKTFSTFYSSPAICYVIKNLIIPKFLENAYSVQRRYDNSCLTDYIVNRYQSDLRKTAVGRMVTVITHNENHTLGNNRRDLSITLFFGRVFDVGFVKNNSVYRNLSRVEIDVKGLTLSGNYTFYNRLIQILSLTDNYDVTVIGGIAEVCYHNSVLIVQSIHH